MKKTDILALQEGVKELLRTALMAVIPLAIINLQEGKFDWRPILIAGAIALLSGIDKWLHKKDTGIINDKGLTGF